MSARVVIVGGGVTGLSAAYHIARARPGVQLTVLESRSRLGGNIETVQHEGFVIDAGPDSFLVTKPDAVKLTTELGLSDQLIAPTDEARNVYMVHERRLERMPAGMILAVPTRLGPMLRTPLLGPAAKLRVLGDLALRASGDAHEADGRDESIQAFISRHFGRQAAERIASPLLGGIYAGNIAELSVRATFPQLLELERRHGSIIRGFFAAQVERSGSASSQGDGLATRFQRAGQLLAWLRREDQHGPSPFRSFRGGMSTLIDALARALPANAVRLSAPVDAIVPDGKGALRVHLSSRESLPADAVILATPAHAAARLVSDADLSTELRQIRYVSTATVFFGFSRATIRHPLDAAGFIVAPNQARIMAGTWVSSKWSHRAPEGQVLIRAFVGGTREPRRVTESTNDELVALAKAELEAIMGPLGEPLFSKVYRYVDANPQPVVGHCARIARITAQLRRLPGLHLAGAAYDGVGIPDCVRQGRAAAERVLGELASKPLDQSRQL